MPNKLTTERFILKSIQKHGHKWDYSKSIYLNSKSKVLIICPQHGEFWQTASDHYLNGCGCPKCDPTKKLTLSEFISKSKILHGEKYSYEKSVYGKNNYHKIIITCKKHGDFLQTPWAHMRGQGCPECSNNKKSTTGEFIKKAKLKHGDIYDYSAVCYTTKSSIVEIICQKHGLFSQRAYVHLQGHGCPNCNNSKLEKYLRDRLLELEINFERNKKWDDCRNKLPLPFDFWIRDLDILIECDGKQHRESIPYFGGEKRFEYQKLNDSIKTVWCHKNNKKLFRVKNFSEIDNLLINIKLIFNGSTIVDSINPIN